MFRQAPSFPYHDLGIVEDGTTASRAISKDSYVIWKGESYFASTDILQGATLEEDVNLTAIPDGVINGVMDALNNNFVKLWENPNPGSEFDEQKIQLSLSAYKAVLIRFEEHTSSARRVMSPVVAPVGVAMANFAVCPYFNGSKVDGFSIRNFNVADTTGVQFGKAYNQTAVNNAQAVPYDIYGLF